MIARRRLVAAVFVPFGVVVSHLIAYAVSRPHGSPRADAVVEAHDHLGPLALVAVLGVAAAVVSSGLAGATGRRLRLTPLSLAGAQAAVFAAMEIAEHVSQGSGLSDVLAEPSLWIGMAVQIAVAAISCALLRVGEAVGERLAARRASRWRRPCVTQRIGFAVDAVRAVAWTPLSRRGPPVVARR